MIRETECPGLNHRNDLAAKQVDTLRSKEQGEK
ncbi:hypothetical protein AmaxDRAFT_5661 [Limnospira maxima CS-328]|uniref:Uncharacterized protein n=1 Tax=Limnospira maxima CS-328 TaxID=513049 RepID=B5WA61_LIMMA|nr:hypothetical protein AmaxDRAFT_5661 [Limnospira maxima CS-328]